VYDIMTRRSIHNMAQGGSSQADIAAATGASLRSVQRILTELLPAPNSRLNSASSAPTATVVGERRGQPPWSLVTARARGYRTRSLASLRR